MSESEPQSYQILIVDDEESIRTLLTKRLGRIGYRCVTAADGAEGLAALADGPYDMALVDINMPGMNGIEVLRRIQSADDTLSVSILTAYADTETAVDALRFGAYDFLNKPFEFDRLTLAIANGIERTRLLRLARDYTRELEEQVAQRTAELEAQFRRLKTFFLQTTNALVTAIEAKDKYTEGHSRRVAELGRMLALAHGMDDVEAERLYVAGILHDVGKIGVPDHVLLKNGKLDDAEWTIMKSHSEKSAEIIAHIDDMVDVTMVIRGHHEWFDGSGYPDGIVGEHIPLGARILIVADAFDAMTTTRPYRGGRSLQAARDEIARCSGTQFDPAIAETFLHLIDAGNVTVKAP
jgi:response regulator RpfG family c-di-GMP phosphodiesterase